MDGVEPQSPATLPSLGRSRTVSGHSQESSVDEEHIAYVRFVRALQERIKGDKSEITIMQGRVRKLDQINRKIRNQMLKERKVKQRFGGEHAISLIRGKIKKKARLLKSRINALEQKYSLVEGSNRGMRRDIDALRDEIMVAKELKRRLKDDMEKQKRNSKRYI